MREGLHNVMEIRMNDGYPAKTPQVRRLRIQTTDEIRLDGGDGINRKGEE